MPVIKTKTTYLQMFSPPEAKDTPPRTDLDISRIATPCLGLYRRLYREVGSTYHWVDRLVMPEKELEAIIHDDQVDIFVLKVAEELAGYSELDRRQPGDIELAYFGLFPKVIGQGLGKYLLHWTLQAAWSHRPQRVWVHTCDLDHPAALPNYLTAGFRVYDEAVVDQWIPAPPS